VLSYRHTYDVPTYDVHINDQIMRKTQQLLPSESAPRLRTGPLMKLTDDVPPVRRVPLALARRFFQICNAAAAKSLVETDLVPLEFAVLAYINSDIGEPGLDQSSLAARIGIDRNSTSQLVAKLQARGLLDVSVSASDRRLRTLRLTPRGEKLYLRLQPLGFADQTSVLTPLKPDEREKFLDYLVRVIEGNRALARPGAARRKRGSVSDSVST
jgi:DNA-binding MarR family transcriptional regulator